MGNPGGAEFDQLRIDPGYPVMNGSPYMMRTGGERLMSRLRSGAAGA
jgi:hypothetical protein